MKKHTTEDAFYDRMRQLAEVKSTSTKAPKDRTLGTLIDYKKATDGVAYGIIKESHNYYIKKAGIKENPDVSDFAYIGGLSNITEFQYKTLAEADKQRNMIFNTINEGLSKVSKTGSKTTKKGLIKENFGSENGFNSEDEFIPQGSYMVSNSGGYEVMLSNSGDAAKVRDAFGSENPETSDWLEIEYVTNEDDPEGDLVPIIDPNGYNIPLDQVMRIREGKKTNKKLIKEGIEEDLAGDKIKDAESKMPDLEAATDAADAPAEMPIEPEMNLGGEEMPAPEGEMPMDSPEGEMGGEEMPTDEPEADLDGLGLDGDTENMPTDDEGGEEKSLTIKEIEKGLGKITNKIRGTELEPSQVNSYVKSFLSAFEDKFDLIDDDDKEEMVEKIMKPKSEEDDTDFDAKASEEEIEENEVCEGCGGFTKYAESRGYTKESIMECDDEEMNNLIAGYASGDNTDDIETVSLFTKPNTIDSLKNEYGHNEFANELEPHVNSMNEAGEDDKIAKINELNWSNSENSEEIVDENEEPIDEEYANMFNLLKRASKLVGSDKQQYDNLQSKLTKDGELSSQDQKQMIDLLSKKDMNEGKKPSAGLTTKKKSEVVKKAKASEDLGKKGKGFEKVAKKATKEYGSKEAGEKETKEPSKTMTESEQKLRKYVHTRIEELKGLRKPLLTENKKSETLKKLDRMIEKQYKLQESSQAVKIKDDAVDVEKETKKPVKKKVLATKIAPKKVTKAKVVPIAKAKK